MLNWQDKTKPWERQPKESARAFEAFTIYLGMGADRSIPKVAHKLTKSRAIIHRWCSAWEWVERVRAYDNYIIAEQAERARKDVKDRYARFGEACDRLIDIALTAISATKTKRLKPRDVAAFLRLAVTLADKHKEVFAPPETDGGVNDDMLGGLLSALLGDEAETDGM